MLNFLRHVFLPHASNGHRPKILHHNIISVFIIVLLGLLYILPPIQREYPSVLGVSYNITVNDLVRLTNQKRAEAGLTPLKLDNQLSAAAQSKLGYMFEKNFWAHIAPDGTTPWYFIKNAGYEYQYAGENLARGFSTAEAVTDAWMASPTHRENLLSPNYDEIGFAIGDGTLTGSETVLVVQEFGRRYKDPGEVASAAEDIQIAQAEVPVTDTVNEKTEPKVQKANAGVAAGVNKPLIDSKSTARNIGAGILLLFILVLIIDAIFIERRKISRILAHNLDHIIFLVILLLIVIIIGGGKTL